MHRPVLCHRTMSEHSLFFPPILETSSRQNQWRGGYQTGPQCPHATYHGSGSPPSTETNVTKLKGPRPRRRNAVEMGGLSWEDDSWGHWLDHHTLNDGLYLKCLINSRCGKDLGWECYWEMTEPWWGRAIMERISCDLWEATKWAASFCLPPFPSCSASP